jgi:predicted transcriptional regulator
MKFLAGVMVIGFLMLAVLSGISPFPMERKNACCTPDNSSGRPTCHMTMTGQGIHTCSCKTTTASSATTTQTNSCNGACGSLMATIAQPSSLLDRLRRYAVSGYRRITNRNLLEHDSRRQIYEEIVASPGADIRKLTDITGMNESTLRYHLERLYDGGKIQATTIGGVCHYFENHGKYSTEEQVLRSRMLTTASSRILMIIFKQPGLTRGELADLLGVAGPTVTRSVQNLTEDGLIRIERDGRFTRYYPEESVRGCFSREYFSSFVDETTLGDRVYAK